MRGALGVGHRRDVASTTTRTPSRRGGRARAPPRVPPARWLPRVAARSAYRCCTVSSGSTTNSPYGRRTRPAGPSRRRRASPTPVRIGIPRDGATITPWPVAPPVRRHHARRPARRRARPPSPRRARRRQALRMRPPTSLVGLGRSPASARSTLPLDRLRRPGPARAGRRRPAPRTGRRARRAPPSRRRAPKRPGRSCSRTRPRTSGSSSSASWAAKIVGLRRSGAPPERRASRRTCRCALPRTDGSRSAASPAR